MIVETALGNTGLLNNVVNGYGLYGVMPHQFGACRDKGVSDFEAMRLPGA